MQTLALVSGDTLLLYTDGVTEAVDPKGVFFGSQQLDTVARTVSATTAQGLCDHIMGLLATFQSVAPQADDITLVAMRAT